MAIESFSWIIMSRFGLLNDFASGIVLNLFEHIIFFILNF